MMKDWSDLQVAFWYVGSVAVLMIGNDEGVDAYIQAHSFLSLIASYRQDRTAHGPFSRDGISVNADVPFSCAGYASVRDFCFGPSGEGERLEGCVGAPLLVRAYLPRCAKTKAPASGRVSKSGDGTADVAFEPGDFPGAWILDRCHGASWP
jgi:hypothetical protein